MRPYVVKGENGLHDLRVLRKRDEGNCKAWIADTSEREPVVAVSSPGKDWDEAIFMRTIIPAWYSEAGTGK